jgi:hypothetical protein
MLGSYGPSPTGEPYIKNFDPEESPSGMIARLDSYNVKSQVIDDDGEVYAGLFFFCLYFVRAQSWILSRLGMVFQTYKRMVKAWTIQQGFSWKLVF